MIAIPLYLQCIRITWFYWIAASISRKTAAGGAVGRKGQKGMPGRGVLPRAGEDPAGGIGLPV
jgi:hypothetical protein